MGGFLVVSFELTFVSSAGFLNRYGGHFAVFDGIKACGAYKDVKLLSASIDVYFAWKAETNTCFDLKLL